MTQHHQSPSGLMTTVSGLSKCIGIIGVFYAAPWIVRYFHSDMYSYLVRAFDGYFAYWGAWIFVAVIVLAVFFGASAILQFLMNTLIRKLSSTQRF